MTKLVPHFSINCIDDTCLHLSIVLYFLDILKIIPIFDQEKLEGVEYIRLLARSNEDSREKKIERLRLVKEDALFRIIYFFHATAVIK